MGGTKCLLSPTPKNMGDMSSPTQTRPMLAADPIPLTVMASEFRTWRQQPLSQNPADTPGISMLSYLCPFIKRFIFLYEASSKHSLIQDGHQFNMAAN